MEDLAPLSAKHRSRICIGKALRKDVLESCCYILFSIYVSSRLRRGRKPGILSYSRSSLNEFISCINFHVRSCASEKRLNSKICWSVVGPVRRSFAVVLAANHTGWRVTCSLESSSIEAFLFLKVSEARFGARLVTGPLQATWCLRWTSADFGTVLSRAVVPVVGRNIETSSPSFDLECTLTGTLVLV